MAIKILILSPTRTFFGSEKSLWNLLARADRDSFEFTLAIPFECQYADKFESLGIRIYRCDLSLLIDRVSIEHLPRLLKLNFELLTYIRKNDIDILHVNLTKHLKRIGLFFAFLRKPYVCHLRTANTYDLFERAIFRKSKRLIFVSGSVKRKFFQKRRSDALFNFPESLIEVMYDGRIGGQPVSVEHRQQIKAGLGVAPQEKVLAIVGAFEYRKRQDLFLQMAQEIKRRRTDVKFLIIGDVYGNNPQAEVYKKSLLKTCQDLQLDRDVVFTGYRHDVEDILQVTDILVVPSMSEALGGQAIEAMAAGVPVIAAKVEGLAEVVKDEVTGFLMSGYDVKDYADRALDLLNDEEKRKRMGQAGLERFKEIFDVSVQLERMEKVYHEVLKHGES